MGERINPLWKHAIGFDSFTQEALRQPLPKWSIRWAVLFFWFAMLGVVLLLSFTERTPGPTTGDYPAFIVLTIYALFGVFGFGGVLLTMFARWRLLAVHRGKRAGVLRWLARSSLIVPALILVVTFAIQPYFAYKEFVLGEDTKWLDD